ncbi:MAG: phenylalanine--tRNA ligase subunit beta, partial [Deltaproteobacteria bacterium]|nr:phenylalanine--tRNA ligase subunit beta [Deltaproteobacteria bacterium]
MPVIGIPIDMLLERVSTSLDRDQLVEHLQHLGCDMEGFATVQRFRCLRCDNLMEITSSENPPVLCDRCGADFKERPDDRADAGEQEVIRMELLPVRPDMFDVGGLARVMRNYLSESLEPAAYPMLPPTRTVRVDGALASEECPRPYIVCAIVRDITLSDDLIKAIMKLQENLHLAMGRDRKHASIGVYDLDTVQGTDFTYRAVGKEELRFVPLGLDPGDEANRMTPRQILEEHPKGTAYARLLEDFKAYPLLEDGTGQVLSMPPIINSESTRVRGETTSFFVDVTGTDERLVNRALNVLATSIIELDPEARLEQVSIAYPDHTTATPDLAPQIMELDPLMTATRLGIDLEPGDVVDLLRRMGHGVAAGAPAEALRVEIPAYRNDIMHPMDLVEDVAIAYGYHNVEPCLVPTLTVGLEQEIERHKEVARRAMVGQGFFEIITLTLSSHEADFDGLRLPRRDDCVLIENPISVEQTILRSTLL